jgi:CubicO group peptidase (beta-lactamase class C family)
MASINSAKIIALVEKATNQNEGGAAGIAFQAVDKTGKVLASTASGVKSIATSEPVSLDTLFWIASCSKLTTSIALMQLVERGEADLDDAELVARVLPELAAAKVLENGVEREQEGRITLRMLLTHTAGLSYTFLWEEYWKSIGKEEGRDEFQGKADAFIQPLKYQPGKGREYAVSLDRTCWIKRVLMIVQIGIDWCGIFIERTTGLKLGKYFEKNIFEPLGLTSTAFVPTEEMRGRLASMHTRDETGKLQLRKHLNRIGESADGGEDYFHSGGGGLFSTVTDYCSESPTNVLLFSLLGKYENADRSQKSSPRS